MSEELPTDTPEQPVEPTPHGRPRGGRFRAIATVVVGIVAVLALVVSIAAVWANAVLFNSDRVATIASDALADPAVNAALAQRVSDMVLEATGAQEWVGEQLPDALAPLQPVLSGGMESLLTRQLERVLAREETQAVLTASVRTAHEAAMKLLSGDGLVDGISVSEGEVSLNLLPLLGRGLEGLQDRGLLTNVTLPELDRSGDPAEQIAALEAATGRDLADDFGQVVVYRSEQLAEAGQSLAQAQRAMVVMKRGTVLLIVLTVGLFAGSLLLARNRRIAGLSLSLGAAATLFITLRVVSRIESEAPQLVLDPAGRAAIKTTVAGLTESLVRLVVVLGVVALVAALWLFITGSSPTARSIRERLVPDEGGFPAFLDAHHAGVAVAVFAAAVLSIMWLGIGSGGLIAGVALGALGVWVLSRVTPEQAEDVT